MGHRFTRSPDRRAADPGSSPERDLASRTAFWPRWSKRFTTSGHTDTAEAASGAGGLSDRSAALMLPSGPWGFVSVGGHPRLIVTQDSHVVWKIRAVMMSPMIGSAIGTPRAMKAVLTMMPPLT